MTLSTIFTIIALVIGFGLIFFMIANHVTYKQRNKIIKIVYKFVPMSDDYSKTLMKHKLYNQVTYNQHMIRLLTLRNPYKLYDPRIFEE